MIKKTKGGNIKGLTLGEAYELLAMRDEELVRLRKELEEAQNKIQHLEAEGVKWIERIAAQRDACAAGPWQKGGPPRAAQNR